MATVKFAAANTAPAKAPSNLIIIAHNADALADGVEQNESLKSLVAPATKAVLEQLVKAASPSKEAAGSAETLVHIEGDEWQRIVVCLLPTAKPSRHAAPGHPHIVMDLARSKAGSKNTSIVLLVENPSRELFSSCCAVSRGFPVYSVKSSKPTDQTITVYPCCEKDVLVDDVVGSIAIEELEHVANNVRDAAMLVDMPTSALNVSDYVAHIRKVTQLLSGVTVEVITGEELKAKGLGGIYGVGKASADPPSLVILSHNQGSEGKSVCMVGKGIVYDTGGLSIKTKTGMPGMKRDMGGSAGVLGAFCSLVGAGGLPNGAPLYALLCIAENSVAATATRPDDVHTFYSGKTVEINNTDAEGRLVLADGMAYAVKNLNPSHLIDMATLTGAQASATGHKHAAFFTNSEQFEDLTLHAGRLSGDLTHALPYTPEFFRKEFKSAIADMKNSAKDRTNCGSAGAATFLSNHIESFLADEGNSWLHVDMASPAYSGERATGYGVALLFLVARGIAKL